MFKLSRLLIVYAIAAPLALILGFLVSSPGTFTFEVIGLLLLFFALPIFLKWHHVLLIVLWNSVFQAGFLPGEPQAWFVIGLLSFGISILNHVLFQKQFLRAPELTRALLFLSAVVVITMGCRGGIGVRALGGSSFGGRYYYFILVAVAGYFAFTAEAIPIVKSGKLAAWFLAAGATNFLGNLIYMLGPAFYIFYYIVPSSLAVSQMANDTGATNIERISSLSPACNAIFCLLLARFGIRGIFENPWRLAALVLTIGASAFAGFRSAFLMFFLIFAIQFYLEGLLQTRFLPIVVGLALLGMTPILFFSKSMPTGVQRAISFLPVNVDSEILEDARESSQWRFDMWAVAVKDVPKYLLLGKGYGVDPNELYLVYEAQRMGMASSQFESQLLTGDYHNGPLSVIVPFGIFGVIGFLWVLNAGFRVLSLNRRFGDGRLRRINTTLLAYYLAHCVGFFFIYGAFYSDMALFLGILGFSVSLNGGVRRKVAPKPKPASVSQTLAMEPG